ncbi:MAG: hypothetical protein KDA93_11405 [Planctomycetaceae bacterium]|nr:hypothetical protein [Planctomycetaceae bacterium]
MDASATVKSLLALMLLTALVNGGEVLQAADVSEQKDSDGTNGAETLAMIVESIERNYAPIETLQASIEQLSITPAVEKREVKQAKLAGGGRAEVTVTPVSIQRSDVVLVNDDWRSTLYDRVGDNWSLVQEANRVGDVWTFFYYQSDFAQIKFTHHLGGMMPHDPRDFGSQDMKVGLLNHLQQMKVVVARELESPTGSPLITVTFARQHDLVEQWTFDPAMNHLPTKRQNSLANGNLISEIEIDYQEIMPGVWFLRDSSTRFFNTEGPILGADAREWTQLISRRVIGEVLVNKDVGEDALTIEFGASTRIVDQTRP